ncbi:MAG: FmdB family zinc ribbon protein [Thermoanaerobaculia bacterium]
MPIYEYQCASCGKKTEFIQSFSDPQPLKCPSCGGVLKKLLSSPTAHFKGSGFHATDYAKSGGKPEDSSKGKEADGDSTSDAGAGTKGDSAGDGAKESGKESSQEPTKNGGASATEAGAKREAPGSRPSSPPKKKTPTK